VASPTANRLEAPNAIPPASPHQCPEPSSYQEEHERHQIEDDIGMDELPFICIAIRRIVVHRTSGPGVRCRYNNSETFARQLVTLNPFNTRNALPDRKKRSLGFVSRLIARENSTGGLHGCGIRCNHFQRFIGLTPLTFVYAENQLGANARVVVEARKARP
jgi:hypothetical protein